MYLTKLFTLLAAATYATTTSAACWKSGPTGDKSLALRSLDLACDGLVGKDAGSYLEGNEERTICVADTKANVKWDFTIKNKKFSTTNSMTHKVCYDNLKQEIDKCKLGGHHSKDSFNFISDVNSGVCQAGISAVNAHGDGDGDK